MGDRLLELCFECDLQNKSDRQELKQYANDGHVLAQTHYADICLRMQKKPRKVAMYYILAARNDANVYSFIMGLKTGNIILNQKTPISESLNLLSEALKNQYNST
jgi:hypothetical protein